MPLTFGYSDNSRGLGLADMAKSLENGGKFRADYKQTLHVLEILESFEKSSSDGVCYSLETAYNRSMPMKNN